MALGAPVFLLSMCGPGVECPAGQEGKDVPPEITATAWIFPDRLRQQEARRKLVSSVRHQCREARPMGCRSAGPTRSLSMARRAIKARWRSIIHHSTLLSFGIVGDPAGSRAVCPVPRIIGKKTGPQFLSTLLSKLCQQGEKLPVIFFSMPARRFLTS